VSGCYTDRFAIRNYEDVRWYKDSNKIYPQLPTCIPVPWQVMNAEDSYPVYLKLYLLEHKKEGGVVQPQRGGRGCDLLTDSCASTFPLQGYTRWADKEGNTVFDGR